jgi:hypothetical protein
VKHFSLRAQRLRSGRNATTKQEVKLSVLSRGEPNNLDTGSRFKPGTGFAGMTLENLQKGFVSAILILKMRIRY